MSQKYVQKPVTSGNTQFTHSAVPDLEFSKFTNSPELVTAFNAGDIVPIYCAEVLPHDTFEFDVNFTIRQSTARVPTMGEMFVDYYAFFVPNRVVNKSWVNVMGENTSGMWVAPEVELAPLVVPGLTDAYEIPVGSVADYYGFPTQMPLISEILEQCHDLKFRGYLEIYNEYFRDQNYQPPIAYSKLNLYNGFFQLDGTIAGLDGNNDASVSLDVPGGTVADGSFPVGAIVKEVYGEGSRTYGNSQFAPRLTAWSALNPPLKANKLHDLFTTLSPTPQKGIDVVFGISGSAPLGTGASYDFSSISVDGDSTGIDWLQFKLDDVINSSTARYLFVSGNTNDNMEVGSLDNQSIADPTGSRIIGTNLYADLSKVTGISVSEFRHAATVQQLYEILATAGSRYREFIDAFFGLDTVNNFPDIPQRLGHIRRKLDLYQVAQTSNSVPGTGVGDTPQGNLSAFGYTSQDGKLFTRTFLEHGYIHVFAVVRHKNLYSSLMARDNFRRASLDFYNPVFANLGQFPVYTREINPFAAEPDGVLGYTEAWYDYRMEPSRVTGAMRTFPAERSSESLAYWNFADSFDYDLEIVDGEWLKSNSQDVLDRTLAVTSSAAPQFTAQFVFKITKQRPMPVYSIPGIDII